MKNEYDIEKINRENFRCSLEALARPGEPQPLHPLFGSGLVAMASVLLYAEASFYYEGELDFQMVRAICGSQSAAPAAADYIFSDTAQVALLSLAKTGSPENPEGSATLLLGDPQASAEKNSVILSGPGINGSREQDLPFSYEFIEKLMEKNESFPMGVDLFYLTGNNTIFGLPRTTKIKVIV